MVALRGAVARLAESEQPDPDLSPDVIGRRLYHLNAVTQLLSEADARAAAGLGYRKLLLAARYLRAFVYPPPDDPTSPT